MPTGSSMWVITFTATFAYLLRRDGIFGSHIHLTAARSGSQQCRPNPPRAANVGRCGQSMRETASRFFSVILRNLSVCTFLMMIQMGIANTPSALGGHEACTYHAECCSR